MRSDVKLLYGVWYKLLNAGTQFEKQLRWLKSFQYASYGEIYEFQLNALRNLFDHCYRNVPFYRKSWRARGFRLSDFRELESIDQVPVTTRSELRSNFPFNTCAHNVSVIRRVRKFTSGSTGMPLEFYNDRATLGVRLASRFLHNEWLGLRPTDNVIRMTHHQAPYRSMVNETQVSTLAVTGNTARDIIRYIERSGTAGIVAFPSVLRILARSLISSPRNVGSSLKTIISTGEPLMPSEPARLSEIFSVDLYERYSAQEVPGEFGQQCLARQGMHWNPGIVFLEVRREERAAGVGEIGRVLLTDLWNRVMPIVRYEIGDEVQVGSKCKCGRAWATVVGPVGRLQDRLILRNGNLMTPTGLAAKILEEFGRELTQLQFVETGDSAYKIRVMLSPSTMGLDLSSLRDYLAPYFREVTVVEGDFVRLPSGKTPVLVRA